MTAGRCAGCAYEDKSCKKVKAHVTSCKDFLALFKENPDAALDPEVEYERHRMEMDATKDSRRETKIAGFRTRDKARVGAQASRWETPTGVTAQLD